MRLMLLICHDSSFTERTVKGNSAVWLKETEWRRVRKMPRMFMVPLVAKI